MFITGAANPGNNKEEEEVNGTSIENQELIENHRRSAVHHEAAAKHHLEAVRHRLAGNVEEASQNAQKANEHSFLALEVEKSAKKRPRIDK